EKNHPLICFSQGRISNTNIHGGQRLLKIPQLKRKPALEELPKSLDVSADGPQLFFDFLIATVYVVDPIDCCFALSSQACDDQRCGGSQIRGNDSRAHQPTISFDLGLPSLYSNVCSHSQEL